LNVLSPDVVLLGDGGGIKHAALHPVVGAPKVARYLLGGLARFLDAVTFRPTEVNGHPALVVRLNGALDTVVAVRVDDGLITGLYAVRNPEKLSRMGEATALRR
jgi:RNA polymerase sigma-70 factor (ECF subfamily)